MSSRRPARRAPRVAVLLVVAAAAIAVDARAAADPLDARLAQPIDRATVVRLAVERNATVAAASARARASEVAAHAEGALPPPMAMAQVWQVPFARPWALNRQMIMVGVQQDFPAPGVLAAREEARAQEARVEAIAAGDRARAVARDAGHAFVDYAEAVARHRVHRDHLALAQRVIDVASARQAAGGSLVDVAQAEVERARVEADVATEHALATSARARLNALLARAPDAPIGDPVEGEPVVPASDAAQLVARAREVRPELRAATAERDARALDERAAAREATWPSFSIAALYFPATEAMPEHGYGVNASMSLPWLWGAADRKRDAAIAALQAASTEQRGAHIAVDAEVVSALAAAKSAGERLAILRARAAPASTRAFEAVWSAYAAGRGDVLSILSAERAIADVREAIVMARASLDHAMVDLDAAVGEAVPRAPLAIGGGDER